jgi:hypothetical protein
MTGESPGDRARPHTHTHYSPSTGSSSTSTATRDCSTSRSVAHTREASQNGDCTNCGTEVQFNAGFVRCPNGCTTEPEGQKRAAVRYGFRDHPDQMRYLPASREPKRTPMKDYRQPPIDRILAALLGAGCDYRPAKSVDEWEAHCPTHTDSRPSLAVRRNGDGSVWLKCWSGCSKEGILAALSLEWRDLWDAAEHDPGRRQQYAKPLLAPHLRRAMEELLRLDDERRAR